jgi:hypothetical protein
LASPHPNIEVGSFEGFRRDLDSHYSAQDIKILESGKHKRFNTDAVAYCKDSPEAAAETLMKLGSVYASRNINYNAELTNNEHLAEQNKQLKEESNKFIGNAFKAVAYTVISGTVSGLALWLLIQGIANRKTN